MSTLKKSFFSGIMMFAALTMVIPATGTAEQARSMPKVTEEDVALTVRVYPGYRFRGGYYYGPRYRFDYGYPRYYYYPGHQGFYHYNYPYHRWRGYYRW